MNKLFGLKEIADRYGVSTRSARKIVAEAGETKILGKVFVTEDALEAYEKEKTQSSVYQTIGRLKKRYNGRERN